MKYFTKKELRKIKWGDHDALMNAIEYLIDLSHEDMYDLGYESALADLEVYAGRLAERLSKEAKERGAKSDKKGFYLLDEEEVTEIVKEFFNDFKIENDGRE